MCSDSQEKVLMTAKICRWIDQALREGDGLPSTRRLLFAMAVAFALGLATAVLCIQRTLTPEAVDIVKTVLWSTAACLGVGKFAERV